MQSFLANWSLTIFWSVLALLYLVLAIVIFIRGKPILKDLAEMEKEGPDSGLTTREGKEISLNTVLHKAYKEILIADIVGFIIASLAAIIVAIN